jgi:hypothetical protein
MKSTPAILHCLPDLFMHIKKLLRAFYNKIPIVGDLKQIRETLHRLNGEICAARTARAINLSDFQLENHPRYSDPARLFRHAFQVCSQNGEDGIIREIFRRIGTTNRVFAEVGIGDGSENNTAFLLSQGWTGFWVDGSRDFLGKLRKRNDLRNSVRGTVSFVTKDNIAPFFLQMDVPKELDFLSLDIDQNTFYVWESLRNFRPRVVVVEYNASIPPDIDWKVHYMPGRIWDGTHNFGASLKAFELLGRQLGYSLVGCEFIGANAFFVRDDLVADHFARPFTSENHYEPPRYSLGHRRGHISAILDRKN